MPTVDKPSFLARHAFQEVRTADLAASGNADVRTLAAADTNADGAVGGIAELSDAYARLLALDGSNALSTGTRAGQAYAAFTLLLATKSSADAPLAGRSLASCPELLGVAAGVVVLARNGKRTAGMGLVQDALNEIAAKIAASGASAAFAVDTGAGGQNRGIFGPRSETAVAAFQGAYGLAQTGAVDAATLLKLDEQLAVARAPAPTPPPTPTPTPTPGARFADASFAAIRTGGAPMVRGASGPAVSALQQALLDMGFALKSWTSGGREVGGVDGGFGAQTENALKGFQLFAKTRMPSVIANGTLDKATLEALDAYAPAPGAQAWSGGQPNQAPAPYWQGDGAKRLRIVVVKDQHRTFLFDETGKVERVIANAHGADGNATAAGFKKITTRLDLPATQNTGRALWDDPNAFGTRILDLSWADRSPAKSGEELHGTFARKDMGKNVSHGCVRHYNEDIEYVFSRVATGDLVAIVDSASDPRLKMPAGQSLPAIV